MQRIKIQMEGLPLWRLYYRALRRHLVVLMSGIGSVFISLISALLDSNKVLVGGTAVAGIVCLYWAGYRAWKDEHLEASGKQWPSFRGKITDALYHNVTEPENILCVYFSLDLSNFGNGTSSISSISVLLSDVAGNVFTDSRVEVAYPDRSPFDPSKLYARGQGDRLLIRARFLGIDERAVNRQSITVCLTDAFREQHFIK